MQWSRVLINGPTSRTMDGPWSHGASIGPFIFTSGQVPVVPESGQVIDGGPRSHARQSLENVLAIVVAAGGTADSIAKTTLFIRDYDDFGEANEAYSEFFKNGYPARTCITARELPIIGGVQVLTIIEAVAFVWP